MHPPTTAQPRRFMKTANYGSKQSNADISGSRGTRRSAEWMGWSGLDGQWFGFISRPMPMADPLFLLYGMWSHGTPPTAQTRIPDERRPAVRRRRVLSPWKVKILSCVYGEKAWVLLGDSWSLDIFSLPKIYLAGIDIILIISNLVTRTLWYSKRGNGLELLLQSGDQSSCQLFQCQRCVP